MNTTIPNGQTPQKRPKKDLNIFLGNEVFQGLFAPYRIEEIKDTENATQTRNAVRKISLKYFKGKNNHQFFRKIVTFSIILLGI